VSAPCDERGAEIKEGREMGIIRKALGASQAFAGTSDVEKIAKLAFKYAVPSDVVFTPKFKPKALCYCLNDPLKRVGFLVTNPTGTSLVCGIPTTVTPEGMLAVVDYGCPEFSTVAR
jgi:hypothetical protein